MTAPPRGRSVVQMHWRDLLFMHWPVDPERVRRLLPASLEPDTFDGRAWIGLIPFAMPRVRHAGLPLPGAGSMLECNVRTYVRVGDTPAVWFFTLDADRLLNIVGARLLYNLNYRLARMSMQRAGARITYSVRRLDHSTRRHLGQRYPVNAVNTPSPELRCAWEVGEPLAAAQPGDLNHFLTERYALVTVDRRQRVMIGPIDHEPWRLRSARLVELHDELVPAAGLDLPSVDSDAPSVFCSDGVDARAWPLRPM